MRAVHSCNSWLSTIFKVIDIQSLSNDIRLSNFNPNREEKRTTEYSLSFLSSVISINWIEFSYK